MRKSLFLSLIITLAANLLFARQSRMELSENPEPLKVAQGNLPPAVMKLKIVKVKGEDITGFVEPVDSTSPINIANATGSGFLQTRICHGLPDSPTAGLYMYIYRVAIQNIYLGVGQTLTFNSFLINFGLPVDTFDFDKDGSTGDQVFVISDAIPAIGSVAPSEAIYNGNTITFKFDNPQLTGGIMTGHGKGDPGKNSFFFGLISKKAPRPVGVRAVVNGGTGLNLSARAPTF